MFKTYLFGLVLGVAAAIAVSYVIPVVDQAREVSVVTVQPNGGTSESFHINVPVDRVATGSEELAAPDGVEWPVEFSSARADIYKIRNVHDDVIGVASRITLEDESLGNAVEWLLHFPARGSVYVAMNTGVGEDDVRDGMLRAGTREFSGASGRMTERYVVNDTADHDRRGRIEFDSFFTKVEEGS